MATLAQALDLAEDDILPQLQELDSFLRDEDRAAAAERRAGGSS